MSVTSHWIELPRWTAGRALYSCYLTFADQPDLHHLIDTYQSALANSQYLEPIHRDWLHMTIQGITFVDELTTKEKHQIDAAVHESLAGVPAQTIWTKPAVLSKDSVYIPIEPIDNVTIIREAVRTAVLSVIDETQVYALPGQKDGRFTPHISVAYAKAEGPAAPVLEQLATIDVAPIELQITHASLITLRKDNRRWAWSDEVQIPLKN